MKKYIILIVILMYVLASNAQICITEEVRKKVYNMRELMQKYEVDYLELYDSLAVLPEEHCTSYYILDDGHLSEEGAVLLGDCILELVE